MRSQCPISDCQFCQFFSLTFVQFVQFQFKCECRRHANIGSTRKNEMESQKLNNLGVTVVIGVYNILHFSMVQSRVFHEILRTAQQQGWRKVVPNILRNMQTYSRMMETKLWKFSFYITYLNIYIFYIILILNSVLKLTEVCNNTVCNFTWITFVTVMRFQKILLLFFKNFHKM